MLFGIVDSINLLIVDINIGNDNRLNTTVSGYGRNQRLSIREKRLERFGMDQLFLFALIITEYAYYNNMDFKTIGILLIMDLDIKSSFCDRLADRILYLIGILVTERNFCSVFHRIDKFNFINFIGLQINYCHKNNLLKF